jgi:hypothetical protein
MAKRVEKIFEDIKTLSKEEQKASPPSSQSV